MRTERTPSISEKKEQTYEEAIAALKMAPQSSSKRGVHYNHTVYLQDISKRLYDENLILVALENYKCCRFKDIPKPFRTKKVCLTAMSYVDPEDVFRDMPQDEITKDVCMAALQSCHPKVIRLIPQEFFTDIVFARQAASCCPRCVDDILMAHRQNRENEPYTDGDIAIIREAICPREKGRLTVERRQKRGLDSEALLRGRTFEQYCSEEFGYIPSKFMHLVWDALRK